MIEPQERATAWRRDDQVARVRRLTRYVVAGSLGLAGLLSVVVAHALPGRAPRTMVTPAAATSQTPSSQTPSSQTPSSLAPSSQTPSSQTPSSLAPPAQLPAPSSRPAPVVSGGS